MVWGCQGQQGYQGHRAQQELKGSQVSGAPLV